MNIKISTFKLLKLQYQDQVLNFYFDLSKNIFQVSRCRSADRADNSWFLCKNEQLSGFLCTFQRRVLTLMIFSKIYLEISLTLEVVSSISSLPLQPWQIVVQNWTKILRLTKGTYKMEFVAKQHLKMWGSSSTFKKTELKRVKCNPSQVVCIKIV